MRHRPKSPAITLLLAAALPIALAGEQGREESSAYTVRTDKGEDVHIQRRPDGSFAFEFEHGPGRTRGPTQRGLGDRELVMTLPEPITSRLLDQWSGKMPVGVTANGWFVLRFVRPADRPLRSMVMDDIARQMHWKPIAHEDVGTLYLRPDVMTR